MDAVGDHVAHEQHAVKLGRELVGRRIDNSGNAGAAMVHVGRVGGKARAVVRLAETLIVALAEQHGDCPRVAVGRVQIAQRVEAQAERIDLSPGELLDGRAVGPVAIGVARVHVDQHRSLARFAAGCDC